MNQVRNSKIEFFHKIREIFIAMFDTVVIDVWITTWCYHSGPNLKWLHQMNENKNRLMIILAMITLSDFICSSAHVCVLHYTYFEQFKFDLLTFLPSPSYLVQKIFEKKTFHPSISGFDYFFWQTSILETYWKLITQGFSNCKSNWTYNQ